MKLVVIIIALCLSCSLPAQDVEGVEIDSVMTNSQVVAKFGKPDKYTTLPYEEGFGIWESYYYGKNEFVFYDGSKLRDFYLSDNRFAAFTYCIEGGLKVGDSVSKLAGFKCGEYELDASVHEDGSANYRLFSNSDFPAWVNVKDGIIKHIHYSEPM